MDVPGTFLFTFVISQTLPGPARARVTPAIVNFRFFAAVWSRHFRYSAGTPGQILLKIFVEVPETVLFVSTEFQGNIVLRLAATSPRPTLARAAAALFRAISGISRERVDGFGRNFLWTFPNIFPTIPEIFSKTPFSVLSLRVRVRRYFAGNPCFSQFCS